MLLGGLAADGLPVVAGRLLDDELFAMLLLDVLKFK